MEAARGSDVKSRPFGYFPQMTKERSDERAGSVVKHTLWGKPQEGRTPRRLSLRRKAMVCGKCGSPYMLDDSCSDIKVYKCWACGNRLYVDHPKRRGSLTCSRCGGDMDTENKLGCCAACMKLLNIHAVRTKGRTYGETMGARGTTFIRKSPAQLLHNRDCRKR
jgi:hypothetical protein